MFVSTCPFCIEFQDVEKSEFRSVFDRNELATRCIAESENFIAIAGLGALRPGYVLILTKEHVSSFANLNKGLYLEAQSFVNELTLQVSNHFGATAIFEHGSSSQGVGSGSCIDHAHFHILPTTVNILPILKQKFPEYQRVQGVQDLAQFKSLGQSYVFYSQQGDAYMFNHAISLPSQFLRRLIWSAEGKPTEWDWAVYIGREHVLKTVQLLSQPYIHPRL